jgi:hypothetical protein
VTIVTRGWAKRVDLYCDGCGTNWSVKTDGDFMLVLKALDVLDWITIANDRGYGVYYEHFCCGDCLDPLEWEDQ